MHSLFIKLVSVALSVATIFGYGGGVATKLDVAQVQQSAYVQSAPALGATFQPAALQTYNLAGNGVTSSATSIILSSLTLKQTGQKILTADLSSPFYITLEPGNTTRQEIVSCTTVTQNTSSATLSGCIRGLTPISPYSASTTLSFTHAGGVEVIFSNPPQFYNQIIDYVNGRQFGGIGNASETATGTVEIATGAEAQAGTTNGSLGRLALPSSLATSTYNAATAGAVVVVTKNTGFIDSNFIATSTLFSTSTLYSSFKSISNLGKYSQSFTTPGTTTFSVPTGVTRVKVRLVGGGGTGANVTSCSATTGAAGTGGGGGGGYAEGNIDITGTTSIQVYIGSNAQWSTFGTNGFYMSGNPGGNSTAATNNQYTAGGLSGTGVGGDINIPGATGGSGFGVANSSGFGNGGFGGSSALGFGGPQPAPNLAGLTGTGYGGGGSGAGCFNNSPTNGSVGTQGAVFINW